MKVTVVSEGRLHNPQGFWHNIKLFYTNKRWPMDVQKIKYAFTKSSKACIWCFIATG